MNYRKMAPGFKILLHPKAGKALKKLEPAVQDMVKARLRELKAGPEKSGQKLKYSDYWKLRIGDYRAIYGIEHSKSQIIVLFIGHRENIYDDFSHMLF